MAWPMREPFAISRGTQLEQPCIHVRLTDPDGFQGHGEGCGIIYDGETPETMLLDIDRVQRELSQGFDRETLLTILPKGGARCAVDAALWDLEAKRHGRSPYERALGRKGEAVDTAFTIGIRSIEAFEETASAYADFALLKVKVGPGDPFEAISAVHRGAPDAKLIIDPNQAWSADDVEAFARRLLNLNVVLLEQPIPVGAEATLKERDIPISLAADELINEADDLEKAVGAFDVINIKLDKTGGLTNALKLADQAEAMGFGLMVGCMAGSSLSMAPAHVLAQRCAYVDLDGPLLQSQDYPDAMLYEAGRLHPATPALWG
ncbi:MAG: dipeptide epimerase [Pseudomonadota bacterium]